MEKDDFNTESTSEKGHTHEERGVPAVVVSSQNGEIQEAREIYGNLAIAEQYGYVSRGYAVPDFSSEDVWLMDAS